MPIIGVLELLFQIYFAVHAGKSGRYSWIFIILFFPVIGSLIYFFVEYLPELQMNNIAKKARKPKKQPNIKELKTRLELTDSVKNRLDLAMAYFQAGQFEASIDLLEKSLNGVYAKDLNIIEGLCHSHFHNNNYSKVSEYIEKYYTANNGVLSKNLQMIREKLNENDDSLQEALS